MRKPILILAVLSLALVAMAGCGGNDEGQFKESDDVGRANSQDRRTDAENETRSGQGDRGDRNDDSDDRSDR